MYLIYVVPKEMKQISYVQGCKSNLDTWKFVGTLSVTTSYFYSAKEKKKKQTFNLQIGHIFHSFLIHMIQPNANLNNLEVRTDRNHQNQVDYFKYSKENQLLSALRVCSHNEYTEYSIEMKCLMGIHGRRVK